MSKINGSVINQSSDILFCLLDIIKTQRSQSFFIGIKGYVRKGVST